MLVAGAQWYIEGMDFVEKYPLPLSQIIIAPMAAKVYLDPLVDVPHVTIAGIRPLAEFAGYTYGALRTAVSRMKKRGEILSGARDGEYRLNNLIHQIVATNIGTPEGSGYTLALFSFGPGQRKARETAREILEGMGFVKLTRTAYITGPTHITPLAASLDAVGLLNHIFIFRCDELTDPVMKEKLRDVWHIDEWQETTDAFLENLTAFWEQPITDAIQVYQRQLYGSQAFYSYIMSPFPPLSEEQLPARRTVEAINRFMVRYGMLNGQTFISQFVILNS